MQARNEVLRAQNESKKYEMEVKKMEMKMKHEEILMQRDIQKSKDKMAMERQKSEMAVKHMEAKFAASEASNVAKVKSRTKEANDKAESYAKRRKATYFGSNMVCLYIFCVNIFNFIFY